jgi:uncharacterized protein
MPNPCNARRLILFGRYPVPGRTKTRLIPLTGPLGAAELHRQWTERTLSVLVGSSQAPVDVVYTGGNRRRMRRWLGGSASEYWAQQEGDLGRRMQQAIGRALDQGARQVVLVGTDIPGLTTQHITDAFQALTQHDLVLGPSRDGGYWLIGCRAPAPVFQDIDWGTQRVLSQTLAAAARCGLSVALLPRLRDIDTEADLRHWQPDCKFLRPYLSVVIPALNEAARMGECIAALRAPDIETIVVDGGSNDGTVQAARQAGARVICAPRGRARQQNAGAALAAGRALLFLHADTRLPKDFGAQVFERLLDPQVTLGAFRFKTDWDHWAMRGIERAVQVRCALLHLPYGDQAFFMRKKVFEQAGGFADVPLAEDLLLARTLARRGKVELTPGAAVTSGRSWRTQGIARVSLIHTLIAGGCLLGIDPRRLACLYNSGFKLKTDRTGGDDCGYAPAQTVAPARVCTSDRRDRLS